MNDFLLLTAGPVPLSNEIRDILSRPMIYHRTNEFISVFNRLTQGLKYLFQTKNDVLILTTSGTGGMEAAVSNFVSPGDEIVVVENGKFSERWSDIADEFDLKVHKLKIPWGKSPTAQDLKQLIRHHKNIKAVYLTHCETSTGALTDLETIVPVIRKETSALIIVDAITSAGILPLRQDQWDIDVVVCASQKALGLPPGLSMISLNNRAWSFVEQSDSPRYYLDLVRARQAYRLKKGAAFTPAIPLVFAADHVITNLQKEGLENVWARRHQIAKWFRNEIKQLNLSVFPECPADSLSAIKTVPIISPKALIDQLNQKYNIIVSRGQGKLSQQVIRIGHMANVGERELKILLGSIKEILDTIR